MFYNKSPKRIEEQEEVDVWTTHYDHKSAEKELAEGKSILDGNVSFTMEQIAKRIQVSGTFFDAGCGCGIYLEAAERLGFKIGGCDISELSVQVARKRVKQSDAILKSTFIEADIPHNSITVLLMSGILVHAENPLENLLKARSVLKENGILVIREGNYNLLRLRIFLQKRFHGTANFDFHLNFFTPHTATNMLKKAGFTGFDYLNLGYSSKLIMQNNPDYIRESLIGKIRSAIQPLHIDDNRFLGRIFFIFAKK
jgi:SAM-dependent methyltransferase